MEIKKVNFNTIDVFLDKGWDFWGRFKIKFGKERNQIFQIKGNKFPKKDLSKLENIYNTSNPNNGVQNKNE